MERIHRLSAAFVFAFLCLHFAGHFAGLFGMAAQTDMMNAVRTLYYFPAVHYAVLIAFAVQLATGLPLIVEIWTRRKDFAHQLLAASGAVMTLFIVLHVGWVATARYLLHLDTDVYFVASGLMDRNWSGVLMAFYGLGVFSLFLHFGCIAYGVFKKSNKPVGWVLLLITASLGAYVAWVLLRLYAGHLYPVALPDGYVSPYPVPPWAGH